jgi:hypothetical protein
MNRVVAHVRALWPRWPLLPIAPFAMWFAIMAGLGMLRSDHVALLALAAGLAYGTRTTKKFFLALLPLGLVALLYDGTRFFRNWNLTESTVHLCDLREAELRWFGLESGGVRMTLQDWFQAHSSTWLDLVCAIPYGTFIFCVMAYALFLLFKDFPAQQRFTWGFLFLNLVGFLTYHIYPAAPPWYFHQAGCHVDLAALPSAGPNLNRVDELLGIQYFHAFYGRAAEVFGAVPSLHVAYPLMMTTEGWAQHKTLGRVALIAFYLTMCFSAVYLDHHWVIDIVLGTFYALTTAGLMRAVAWLLSERPRARIPAHGYAEE